jgi:RNA polymerase sigma factor (sigma-70 family)
MVVGAAGMNHRRLNPMLQRLFHLAAGGPTDGQLLARFVSRRDDAAFELLVRRYGSLVWGVCDRVLGNPHDADDAFQATFLVLVRRAASIDRTRPLSAWLHGVAFRIAVRARKRAVVRAQRERAAGHQRSSETPVDPSAEGHDLRRVVDEELDLLPQSYRMPLILCDLEGLAQAQAAQQLGWPVGTLKWRLRRGRERLRDRLTRRGLDPTRGGQRDFSHQSPLPVLIITTVAAALQYAAGSTRAASPEAIALTDGVLKAMTLNKIKTVATLLLTFAIFACGLGGLTWWAHSSGNQDEKPESAEASSFEMLPPGARAQIGLCRFQHTGQIMFFSFSPDSKKLVSVSLDGVHLWDVGTGQELHHIKPRAGDKGNGPVPGAPGGALNEAYDRAEFSPDGKMLAVSAPDRPVMILDPESGKLVREVRGAVMKGYSTVLRFSPDGKQILALDRDVQDKIVRIFDVESGTETQHFEGHERMVQCAAFSADGKHLVTGSDDDSIRLWNVETGKEERIFKGHRSGVLAVALSSDGKYLSSIGSDSSVRIWNAAEGELRHAFPGIGNDINSLGNVVLHFSSDGKVLTACVPDGVHQWETASGKELRKPQKPTGFMYWMSAMSPDEKYIARYAVGMVQRIEIVDAKTEKVVFPFEELNVAAMAVSPDSKLLATAGNDKVIHLWDMKTAKEVRKIEGHSAGVAFLFFTPDGKGIVSAARDPHDRFISIWNVETGKELKEIRSGGISIQAMDLSHSGHILGYIAEDELGTPSVHLIDADSSKEIRNLPMTGYRMTLSLSPDGKSCVYQNERRKLVVSDVARGEDTRMLDVQPLHQAMQNAAVFAPDGQCIAVVGEDGRIHLMDCATSAELRSFAESSQPDAVAYKIPPAFSPDGRLLATDGNDGVILWEVATGKPRQVFRGGMPNVYCVVFAPDGKTLVSSSQNGPVLFWDLGAATPDEKAQAEKLTAKEAERLWDELKADDAGQAWHAMKVLRATPKVALACLSEKLKPAVGADEEKTNKLIADLDADDFKRRDAARQELEKLGELAEPVLRKALRGNPSLEVAKRIEQVLQKISKLTVNPEKIRDLRAIELLERMNSDGAEVLLNRIAVGVETALLTRQAKASLERIKAASR